MKRYHYPKWLRLFYPGSIWGLPSSDQSVLYLTFDDGPSDLSSNWILDELRKYKASATFFCIGEQVLDYPKLFEKIMADGHAVGNHSMTHLKGLKSSTNGYINDVLEARKHIDSALFRPPYGSLKRKQFNTLKRHGFQTVFWSFMAYDFDDQLNVDVVLSKMKQTLKSGDIIVFHDSEKALPQLKQLLPEVLKYYHAKGFTFPSLS